MVRVVLAVLVGAIVAALLGYGVSLLLYGQGIALISPSETAGKSTEALLGRPGLNFEAIHHIRVAGAGLPGADGNLSVSIQWPVSLLVIIPALSLMIGGWVASKIVATRGNFVVGALIALPYVAILLIVREWIAVPSSAIALPALPNDIPQFDPGLIAAVLRPEPLSAIFNGLVLGIIFGGIGAIGGPAALWHGVRRGGGIWPAWIRGAFAAAIGGHIVFLLLLALFIGLWLPKQDMDTSARARAGRSYATLLTTGAGWAHYFAHGVTLTGHVEADPGVADVPPTVQTYQAGLLTGFKSEDKTKPIKPVMFALMVVPAVLLFFAGRAAGAESSNRVISAAMMAGFYALIMTAGVLFFSIATSTAISVGDVTSRTSVVLGPSAKYTFPLALGFGFAFGVLGAITRRAR
jgi:hypothetical protein